MKMRFKRKKLLEQINEGLQSLELLSSSSSVVTYTVASREDVLTKELKSMGNGAFVIRTWSTDARSNRVFSDLRFDITEDTFTSSEGYSVDVMESIAALLMSMNMNAKKRA